MRPDRGIELADRHDEFIRAILDSPFDDGPRWVYADWLEDQGDPRAEFLRLQRQLDDVEPFGTKYAFFQGRERAVLKKFEAGNLDNEGDWLAKMRRYTTLPAPVPVAATVPEMGDLERTVVRLHPHRVDTSAWDSDLSRVGGQFHWPADEAWPHSEQGLPLVPVVQLRKIDVPDLPFPDGTDLLQLLWTAEFVHGWSPEATLRWRCAADVSGPLATMPAETAWSDVDPRAVASHCPAECAIYPERIVVRPDPDTLHRLTDAESARRIGDAVQGGMADETGRFWSYFDHLSRCPGWTTGDYRTHTDDAGRTWHHILNLSGEEHDAVSWRRWLALEDQRYRLGGGRSTDPEFLSPTAILPDMQMTVWCCQDGRKPDVRIELIGL